MAEELAPCAAATMASLRGLGYRLETALADIVDNSISAGAKTVRLDFTWAGTESYISVTDDGSGMQLDELLQAMRIGGKGPDTNRSGTDLGKFGFGLKTASFSQCKRLTVLTKRNEIHHRIWDLDYVAAHDRWWLLDELSPHAEPHLARLNGMPSKYRRDNP